MDYGRLFIKFYGNIKQAATVGRSMQSKAFKQTQFLCLLLNQMQILERKYILYSGIGTPGNHKTTRKNSLALFFGLGRPQKYWSMLYKVQKCVCTIHVLATSSTVFLLRNNLGRLGHWFGCSSLSGGLVKQYDNSDVWLLPLCSYALAVKWRNLLQ